MAVPRNSLIVPRISLPRLSARAPPLLASCRRTEEASSVQHLLYSRRLLHSQHAQYSPHLRNPRSQCPYTQPSCSPSHTNSLDAFISRASPSVLPSNRAQRTHSLRSPTLHTPTSHSSSRKATLTLPHHPYVPTQTHPSQATFTLSFHASPHTSFHSFSPWNQSHPSHFHLSRRLCMYSTSTIKPKVNDNFFTHSIPEPTLPHRRRQAKRQAVPARTQGQSAEGQSVQGHTQASREATSSQTPVHGAQTASGAQELPPDASSVLTSAAARLPSKSVRRTMSTLLSLAKPRLTVLVVLTAMASYALYPVPDYLSHAVAEAAPALSPLTLFFLTVGTALCSSAANTLNMLYEPATDALMTRTRNRPLVRQLVSRRGAVAFAVACTVSGLGALYVGVNPTVAFLGGTNIVLYAGVYTPLKAVTVANTWVGALVGGIPPLMGWAAAAGETATGSASARGPTLGWHGDGQQQQHGWDWQELLWASDGSSIGGWVLASLLFAWQFPHFMALSWPIRAEYRRAGLRMLAWTNPGRNARVAVRYSVACVPICVALAAAGVVEPSFVVTSAPVNGWLVWQAVRFWRYEGRHASARGLFWASVWHLPVVMVLALLQKKGMWQRVYDAVWGHDEEWEDADTEDAVSSGSVASGRA